MSSNKSDGNIEVDFCVLGVPCGMVLYNTGTGAISYPQKRAASIPLECVNWDFSATVGHLLKKTIHSNLQNHMDLMQVIVNGNHKYKAEEVTRLSALLNKHKEDRYIDVTIKGKPRMVYVTVDGLDDIKGFYMELSAADPFSKVGDMLQSKTRTIISKTKFKFGNSKCVDNSPMTYLADHTSLPLQVSDD